MGQGTTTHRSIIGDLIPIPSTALIPTPMACTLFTTPIQGDTASDTRSTALMALPVDRLGIIRRPGAMGVRLPCRLLTAAEPLPVPIIRGLAAMGQPARDTMPIPSGGVRWQSVETIGRGQDT